MSVPRHRSIWLVLATLFLVNVTALGQTVRSGSIFGTITDESGAVLPGVTVSVKSPALQVPQITKVSDMKGEFLFADLPIGTYSVDYELTGFATVSRRDVQLTTGFSARLDVVFKVAAQAENVTVVGDSPLMIPRTRVAAIQLPKRFSSRSQTTATTRMSCFSRRARW